MSKISISKEFGLNPTVETCFICGESIGVALLGTAYKDKDGKVAQAPPQVCCGHACDGCSKIIADGGIFLSRCATVKQETILTGLVASLPSKKTRLSVCSSSTTR